MIATPSKKFKRWNIQHHEIMYVCIDALMGHKEFLIMDDFGDLVEFGWYSFGEFYSQDH